MAKKTMVVHSYPRRRPVALDPKHQLRDTGRDEENAMVAELTARGENPAEVNLRGESYSPAGSAKPNSLETAKTDHDPFDVPSARDTDLGIYSHVGTDEKLEVLEPLPPVRETAVPEYIETHEGDSNNAQHIVSFPPTQVLVESSSRIKDVFMGAPSPRAAPHHLESIPTFHGRRGTPNSWKKPLIDLLYGVGTVGAIGLGAFVLVERFYPQGPDMASAFFVHDEEEKKDLTSYLPIENDQHTVNVHYPLVPSEDKQKEVVRQASVSPLSGMGLYSVAAFISENNVESMSASEQADALKKYRKLTGKQVRGLHDLVVDLIEANGDKIHNVDTSNAGLKDSKKNVIYADVPLSVPKTEKEEKLFSYENRDGQDAVVVHFRLDGPGISQYVAPLLESGWNAAQMQELSALSYKEQVDLVKSSGKEHFLSLDVEDRTPILDSTIAVIVDEENRNSVHRVNTSAQGLKDGKQNVVYRGDKVQVKVPAPDSLGSLEDRLAVEEELSSLGKLVQEYFEVKSIGDDNPSVYDESLFERDHLVLDLARKYNSAQMDGKFAKNLDLSSYSTADRIELAGELYRKTADRSRRDTYMTVEDIVDFVNRGDSLEKISAQDIRDAAGLSRKTIGESILFERRSNLWKDYQELGIGANRKDLVKEYAEKYNLSSSTIYNDLRLMNGIMGTEVPEPKYVEANQ
ncbi:hypothetical protein HZA98_01360 [Candidatus Woesearchaeota archaeon]|nr:hypothetical protein [Candidatus Woesearchaeota archaeon]